MTKERWWVYGDSEQLKQLKRKVKTYGAQHGLTVPEVLDRAIHSLERYGFVKVDDPNCGVCGEKMEIGRSGKKVRCRNKECVMFQRSIDMPATYPINPNSVPAGDEKEGV